MDWKDINIYPELIDDTIIYVSALAVICIISAALSRWKEHRRLKKEFAAYQQRRQDEETEN